MPVEVHGWFAWTVIAPGTAGVLAIAGRARGRDRRSRDATSRCARRRSTPSRARRCRPDRQRSGLVPPMSYSEPSIVCRCAARPSTCRELRPVRVGHRAAGEVDHRDVVLRNLALVAVHATV
jgi:hypothetical protein